MLSCPALTFPGSSLIRICGTSHAQLPLRKEKNGKENVRFCISRAERPKTGNENIKTTVVFVKQTAAVAKV